MFDQVMARIAARFGRVESRAAARSYLVGLLAGVERKNCWQLAERAGHKRPGPLQRLLRYARWDADAVRDDLRSYAAEHLGTDDAVLVVDETGFLKKGRSSAGVQRQYTGTAGRIENAQVGVFLSLATTRGRALIDRRLYLPEHSWSTDPERRREAGILETVEFATKPRLAGEMITAALDAGIADSWVTGDEAYGQGPRLRTVLEARGTGYVLAVACSARVRINHGRTTVRADTVAGRLPAAAWQRHSARRGAKRLPSLRLGLDPHRHRKSPPPADPPQPDHRRTRLLPVLVIHHRDTGRTRPRRWCPLEHRGVFPGRQGPGRTRPLSGQALDIVAPAHHSRHARPGLPDRRRRRRGPGRPAGRYFPTQDGDPISLTVPEIRHLLTAVFAPPAATAARLLHWSIWRRRHQATARRSHYRRRSLDEPASAAAGNVRPVVTCRPVAAPGGTGRPE
ncbi:IS701 family transposase [Streptomyces griseus]|nr:DDE superfamily endonuclease [Streptomyces griseus]SQA27288.1 transposase [Streptomyces griseus]